MSIFSRLFQQRKKPATVNEPPTLRECINTIIEEGRKSTYGWNDGDTAKLLALWSSDRFPNPSMTFNDEGQVFVCSELAEELKKPGNEGLTELLLSAGKQGAAIERRNRGSFEEFRPERQSFDQRADQRKRELLDEGDLDGYYAAQRADAFARRFYRQLARRRSR
jgi:hypothetical protein